MHTLNNCYWFDGSEIIKKELLYNGGFFKNSDNSTFFFPEEKIALAMQLELLKESIIEEIKTNKKKFNKEILNNTLLIKWDYKKN